MKVVELYGRVRYAVQIEGLSRLEAARQFGIDPRTVAKMLAFSLPPGYRRSRPPARPMLDPFTGIIDGLLAADEGRPRKQRHTSKRIFERLRDEHGYSGGGILLATNPRQPLGYVRGLELSPADIIVYGVGSVGHNRSPAAFEWGSMALMQEDIAAAGEALIGRELTAPSFYRASRRRLPTLSFLCPAASFSTSRYGPTAGECRRFFWYARRRTAMSPQMSASVLLLPPGRSRGLLAKGGNTASHSH